jgi:hypothetical protein
MAILAVLHMQPATTLMRKSGCPSKAAIQYILTRLAFFNLLIVALLGVLMRSLPLLSSFPLVYKNVLHGHSHFAFGGWVLPALMALVMKGFPELRQKIAFHHWRNIALLVLMSAYGMLVSFPLQGYKGISISFSTLSIATSFYLALVIWKALKGIVLKTSHRLLKWGLIYCTLSAIGPFATVPLIVMAEQGTPLYFDLIYFYLHFQYNGFFTFTILALLYRWLEERNLDQNGGKVFAIFNLVCIPAYALSVLWHQPSAIFNFVGGAAALLQLAGLFYLLKDISSKKAQLNFLLKLSLSGFALKLIFQAASAFPLVASMAYEGRNFLIAYLHLVLLGFVSCFVFESVLREVENKKLMKKGTMLFLASFFTTEAVLVVQALSAVLNFRFLFYKEVLLFFSLFFVAGSLVMAFAVKGIDRKRRNYNSTLHKSFLLKERTAKSSGTMIQASIMPSV